MAIDFPADFAADFFAWRDINGPDKRVATEPILQSPAVVLVA
jgi:hypothetical protein